MKNKKILVVAAHPDDEVLGCGGTMARLVRDGNEVFTLILGTGITSRQNNNFSELEIKNLKENMYKANEILGVKEIFDFNFPDNKFDSVPLLDIVKTIDNIKNKLKPDIIFTHYEKDLNIDHQIVYKSVLTATRPMFEETVKEIYSFEVLSSTEWSFPNSFSPNIFFDIKNTIDIKKSAMSCYIDELRNYPHPRSIKGIELNSEYWAMRTGLNNVEAFMLIRKIIS